MRPHTLTKPLLVTLAVATLAFGLTACNQIPSLNAQDNVANKVACGAITGPIGEVTSKLTSGDFVALATVASAIPAQLDSALTQVTDGPLTQALTDLKTQVTTLTTGENSGLAQFLATGTMPDLGGVTVAATGITARCAILSATPSL
ncbi:MAG: hypothetical protein JJE28_00015 [Actinomycetales bacterium]|nr:hypothetical protein [Actinomycetales bacterium]